VTIIPVAVAKSEDCALYRRYNWYCCVRRSDLSAVIQYYKSYLLIRRTTSSNKWARVDYYNYCRDRSLRVQKSECNNEYVHTGDHRRFARTHYIIIIIIIILMPSACDFDFRRKKIFELKKKKTLEINYYYYVALQSPVRYIVKSVYSCNFSSRPNQIHWLRVECFCDTRIIPTLFFGGRPLLTTWSQYIYIYR